MTEEPTFVMYLVLRDRTQGRLASLEGVQISLEQCDLAHGTAEKFPRWPGWSWSTVTVGHPLAYRWGAGK